MSMKIKNLRYRLPSGSLTAAILQIICGGLLSLLLGGICIISWVAESFLFSAFGTVKLSFLQLLVLSLLLLFMGVWGCIVNGKYRKLAKVFKPQAEAATVQQISEELVCTPSSVLADLNNTLNSRYWSGYGVTDSALVIVDGSKNIRTILADPNCAFREATRRSRICIVFFVAVWLLYGINPGFGSGSDYAVAGVLSFLVLLGSALIFPKKIAIDQSAVKPQEYKAEEVKTGVEEADNLLREGLFLYGYLADLNKTITDEKLTGTIHGLLEINGQIFDYVKKQPEKAKQIRQLVSYFLPTTVKLLRNYEELSHQPVRGENIRESMQKIEGIMDGILSTFRQHLDDLYRDRNIDISADVAVMENMISQNDVLSGSR
jgi:hypothetical protein